MQRKTALRRTCPICMKPISSTGYYNHGMTHVRKGEAQKYLTSNASAGIYGLASLINGNERWDFQPIEPTDPLSRS